MLLLNKNSSQLFYILFVVIAFSSCRLVNPSQMFRTGINYPYSDFATSIAPAEYKLAINDKFTFTLSTNLGEKLVDPISSSSATMVGARTNTYSVENDGSAKMPIIGRLPIVGKTARELEEELEKEYGQFYNKPFVQVTISNQRIFVFPGSINGEAKVLTLSNANTTLFEAIAQIGGISGGKAHRIKLIRGDMQNPKVYLIDLSTIDGMKRANFIVQANDIIYIESRDRVPSRIIEALSPYLALVTTLLLIYKVF